MEDMTSGRAYFAIEKDGKIVGRPIPIDIPQYAYFLDTQRHRKVPSIILQAEEEPEPGGSGIVAFKDLEQGKERLANFEQFEFLGRNPT